MTTFAAILPNYNDSAALPQALETLLQQTVPFDEIIIVDDASTDQSVAIIRDYAARYANIRFIQHEKNQGVIGALNTGIDATTADYLITCSSNDFYSLNEVERCRDTLAAYPGITMVCGNSTTWDAEKNAPGDPLILTFPQVEKRYTPSSYVEQNHRATAYFNGGAIALKTQRVRDFDRLLPELRWHADLMLYLMFAYTDDFVFLPENLSTSRLEAAKSFSHGRFRWTEQKPVTAAMLRLFRDRYPAQGKLARASAMLPKYNFCNIFLLLEKEHRWYITPLVLWRIAVHTLFYWTRRFLPRPLLTFIRPWFKV